jgi:hypothetical protein
MARRFQNTALSVATERMLDAEDAGDYLTAVYWAKQRARIIALLVRRKHRGCER